MPKPVFHVISRIEHFSQRTKKVNIRTYFWLEWLPAKLHHASSTRSGVDHAQHGVAPPLWALPRRFSPSASFGRAEESMCVPWTCATLKQVQGWPASTWISQHGLGQRKTLFWRGPLLRTHPRPATCAWGLILPRSRNWTTAAVEAITASGSVIVLGQRWESRCA